MNSNLLGLISVIIGVVIMALTLVVILNQFGIITLPGALIGLGSLLTVVFILVAFASSR